MQLNFWFGGETTFATTGKTTQTVDKYLLVRSPGSKMKQQITLRLADSHLLCCRNERNGKEMYQEVVIDYV